jgi:hypothetical protein
MPGNVCVLYNWLKSESGFFAAFDYKNGGPLLWGKERIKAQRSHQNLTFKRHTLFKSWRWKRKPCLINEDWSSKEVARNPK